MVATLNSIAEGMQLLSSAIAVTADSISNKKRLSRDDIARLDKIKESFSKYIQKPICEVFKLNEHDKPLYDLSFTKVVDLVGGLIERFRGSAQNSQQLLILSMASEIRLLFNSLNKRIKNTIRYDSVESMFMYETVIWLLYELRVSKSGNYEDIKKLEQRILYFKEIGQNVFHYHESFGLFKDDNINNPKDVLGSIVDSLKQLHSNMLDEYRNSSFNVKIQVIDEGLTTILSDILNILYFMQAGTKDDVSLTFQIKDFLAPPDHKPKIKDIKSFMLSDWLESTLNILGIEFNDFLSRKEISCDVMDTHLKLEFTPFFHSLGLDDFMGIANEQKMLKPFLEQIISLHRSVLIISFLRTELDRSKQVPNALGEAWIFDNDDGKTIFEGFIDTIKAGVESCKESVESFWTLYHTEYYESYKRLNKLDCKNPLHQQMSKLECFKSNLSKVLEECQQNIEVLKSNFLNRNREEVKLEILKKKKELAKNLHTFLAKIPGYDKTKLEGLRSIYQFDENRMVLRAENIPEQGLEAFYRTCYQYCGVSMTMPNYDDNSDRILTIFKQSVAELGQARDCDLSELPPQNLIAVFLYHYETSPESKIKYQSGYEHALKEAELFKNIRQANKHNLPIARATGAMDMSQNQVANAPINITSMPRLKWVMDKLHCDDMPYRAVSELNNYLKNFSPFHGQIYNQILYPNSWLAGSSLWSGLWTGSWFYSADDRALLGVYQSKLVSILSDLHVKKVAKESPLGKKELELIDKQLSDYTSQILQQLSWLKINGALSKSLNHASKQHFSIKDGQIFLAEQANQANLVQQPQYFREREEQLAEKNKTLETQKQALETKNQTLETQKQALETKNQTLETKNQTLETKNQTLETEKVVLQREIQTLTSDKKISEASKDALKLEIKQAADAVMVSEAKVLGLEKNIENMNQLFNQLIAVSPAMSSLAQNGLFGGCATASDSRCSMSTLELETLPANAGKSAAKP